MEATRTADGAENVTVGVPATSVLVETLVAVGAVTTTVGVPAESVEAPGTSVDAGAVESRAVESPAGK